MPRDIPLGNGSLLVNFDRTYQLRDIYWPHVGQENHTAGHPFRFGVWVDGAFRWITDERWERSLDYEDATLVSRVTLRHPDLGLRLECRDGVDFHENLYFRGITVHDETGRRREVRLFFHQDFHIYGSEIADSAYYEPERKALFHYKAERWFMMNAAVGSPGAWELGFHQWAVGQKETAGREGTWRDAEDGELSGNPVAQGSVDSVGAIHVTVEAGASAAAWYWIVAGARFPDVVLVNRLMRERGPEVFLDRTAHYWKLWVTKDETEDMADLPPEVCRLYRRSLIVLRTQIDDGGAIIAANDYDIARYARDTYSYMWPRDGALVAASLIASGHAFTTRRFFEFCLRAITEEGYLLHKYNPDGSLASSWHAWYADGKKVLPVQEDETALVLWALWRHFNRFRDVEFVKPHYRGLITRAAGWMRAYRDATDHLPLPSWDLWEERRGVMAWTVGAVWAGLSAAAEFAGAFGETAIAADCRRAAVEIRDAVRERFWSEPEQRFARMLTRGPDGALTADMTVDASVMGLWYFGMFEAGDPRVAATMRAVEDRLWVKSEVGGVARYENDYYHRVSDDVPGNPWFICTLWLAQWRIAAAKTPADLAGALAIFEWVVKHALPSGIMAEQVHPFTGEPLSVSPLTWSHSTVVAAVREYVARRRELER